MKKLVFGLIATVMLCSMSFSQEFTSNNYYKLHNKSLEMLLADINTNSGNYINSKNPKIDALIFLQSYLGKTSDIDAKSIASFYTIFLKEDYLNNSEYNEIISSKYYIDLIKITETYSDYKIVIIEIKKLLERLEKDDSVKDFTKNSLKSGMLIGIESAEYWNYNLTLWEKAGSNFNKGNTVMAKTKKMNPHLAADIQGAVGGAVTGAITGGGVGALPGACLGAAWGSAASAFWGHMGW